MTVDHELLLDMLDETQRIRKYRPSDLEALETDEVLQAALVRWIQIIGEAASKISHELQQKYPDTPWKKIAGIRHRVVHDYSNVDVKRIWMVASRDIDVLEPQLTEILRQEQLSLTRHKELVSDGESQ